MSVSGLSVMMTKVIGEGPVIVWLKSSHRFHENPAIDVG